MAVQVWRYPLAALWVALVLAAGMQEESLTDQPNLDLEDLVMASAMKKYAGQDTDTFGIAGSQANAKAGWGGSPQGMTKMPSKYADGESPELKEGLDADEAMEVCDKTWCRPKHSLQALFTKNNKKYSRIGELTAPTNNFEIKFSVKARNDAHIALCNDKTFPSKKKKKCYEVLIGGWKNTKSTLRPQLMHGKNWAMNNERLLNEKDYVNFYIKKEGNKVFVGKAGKKEPFMVHTFYGNEIVENIKYVGVMTDSGSTGAWKSFSVEASEFKPKTISFASKSSRKRKKGGGGSNTKMKMIQVLGIMNSDSIFKACVTQGMRPVCDHAAYFDGKCEVIAGHKHMSRLSTPGAEGAYFYCGRAHGKRTLQQLPGNGHRWSNGNDKNGATLCATSMTATKDCAFKYRGYQLERVGVKGFMNSKNIYTACQAQGMKPVCDHANYQDGKCVTAGGKWHFSHPSHNKKHGIDTSKVQFAFFYCGRAHHQRSLLNRGKAHGHKWTRDNVEADGDTFCAKRDAAFLKKYGSFDHSGYTLKRVSVIGAINSQSIYDACNKKKMRPVCDHASYYDGRCEVVGGWKHMSRDDKHKGITNTYLYCGRAHHNKARQHLKGSHRWTSAHDADGDTLCTKHKPAAQSKFSFRGWEMNRVLVTGYMNSNNIRKACQAKGMKPVCDHSNYQDGKCKAMGRWHMSHPNHDRRHGVDVGKVQYAFFYCGKANRQRSLLNTGRSHKWTHDNRERDGDTFCTKRDSQFMKKHGKFKHNNYELERTPVKGQINSESIYAACRAKGMNPVCDHASYFDGRCEVVGGHKHMSRQDKIKGTWDAYFYCGKAKGNKALQHQHGNSHKWSNGNSKDGDTVCTKRRKQSDSKILYRHYELHRVAVSGWMNSHNILKACKAQKMKPLCDHKSYNDGKCKVVGGSWHFSHPSHDRKHGVDVNKVKWAFFYCGRANHNRALYNTGTTHKWTRDNIERDGDSYCVTRDKDFMKKHGTFAHGGYTLKRVAVSGKINSNSIYAACTAKGMRPVCDHGAYFDGRCIVAAGHRHMSRQDNIKGVTDAYFYCGRANGRKALQHQHHSHRWSSNNDEDGETICSASDHKKIQFTFRGYNMHRVSVKGYMNSGNILKACKAQGMKPACDNSNYQDGKCKSVGGKWHFSHPHHDRQHKIAVNLVKWAFFYCGRANRQRSLINTETSHKWSRDNFERDGDTFCVKRDKDWLKKFGKFKLADYTLQRVSVKGTMDSDTIFTACSAKGMKPVCDHASYFDGRCEPVGGWKHMSRQGSIKGVNGAYFYCGHANHRWSRQHLEGNRHRWSNNNDRDGETLCTKRKKPMQFKFRHYIMYREPVTGYMNSNSIYQACQAKGMKPVCDHSNYQDGKCKAMGRWHMSHPNHDRRHGVDVGKVQYAFFYCGKANRQRSLLNTGRSHKWTHDNRERDGDTVCVKRDPNFLKKYGKFKHKNWTLHRVAVSGQVDSDSIYKACQAKEMRPVCDHASYFDGRCEVVGGWKHMSRQDKIKGVIEAYFYCGQSNGKRALQHQFGNGHRWSTNNDKNGETICTKAPKRDSFRYKRLVFHRTSVDGIMNSANIRKACQTKNLKPVCDHQSYEDGHCKSLGNWHLSHPSHDKSHGINPREVEWAFFYCGRSNHQRSLINQGPRRGHKWSNNNFKDGDTYCIGRSQRMSKKGVKHGKRDLKRVAVRGKINSQSILAACVKKGLRPVCDHAAYFDGQCEVVAGHKHMSRQKKINGLEDAYFYCGFANHKRALQHLSGGNRHRWTNGNDANGDTICTKRLHLARFKFKNYEMHRIAVKGLMNSGNILKACKAKGMKPVCDHSNYQDGKCKAIGGTWHFSHPSHNRSHKVDVKKVQYAFFYCGKANRQRSLLNTGRSHKWTHDNRERDGDTFCAKRDAEFMKKHGTFKHNNQILKRVAVNGRISSESIYAACIQKKMRPVCDHPNYFDGRCIVVNGNRHMSREDKVKGTWEAFFYCGRANGNKALQHMHGKHRWSNKKDNAGETICTKPTRAQGNFKYRHYSLHRTQVVGYMSSGNIRKACQKKSMKPLCDHMSYNDGLCKAIGGNWHFSHPSHDKSHKVDVNKVKWAFFYCGRANHQRSLINTGRTHKWTHTNRERDGDSYCVTRDKDFMKKHGTFKHNNFILKRVQVPGIVNSKSIFAACQKKGLRPVCDHQTYFDGRCIVVTGQKHMSRKDNLKGVSDAYFYCGRANGNKALQHMVGRHRWSNGRDRDGETICTKPSGKIIFTYRSYKLHRMRVSGYMTSSNIYSACQRKNMKPVCDNSNYQDGKCKAVGGRWHFSHPHHDRQHKIDVGLVKWAFFYCGRANGDKALLNTGRTHKWTRNKFERDGDTFCAKRDKDFLKKHGSFKHAKYTLKRVHVPGKLTSQTIYAACTAKKMIPVCDHASYFDGRCEVVGGHKHMSRDDKTKGVQEAYFYCGKTNGNKALQHMHGRHRWSNSNDKNGETICTKRQKYTKFKFRSYELHRTPVNGYMTSQNMFKACQAKGMQPLCDHRNYNDGKCKVSGGNWHFSHPSHDRRYKIDVNKVKWAFFYCGRANGNKALLNTGRTHKWTTNNRERDGDTFCVTKDKEFSHKHGKFSLKDFALERVDVKGNINSETIWAACQKKGLKPVCDHASYFDGRCVVVNGNRHMSRQDATKGAWDAYFYCGSANHNRALQHMHGRHRWSNNKDQNGETVCTKGKPRVNFKFRHYLMERISVSGFMNSPTIFKACQAKGMKPACDHASYADGLCTVVGGNWHLSHPSHDRSHKINVDKVKWAFFYCGRSNHQRSLLNTGKTHKWSRDNRERDGDTFCVTRDKDFLKKYGKFTHAGYSIERVPISGVVNSKSILKSCAAKGMRPVCDHGSYFDGQCEVVRGNRHMSRENGIKFADAYFYCGHANRDKARQHMQKRHRWSNGKDRGGETLCTKRKAGIEFKYRHYLMVRVAVSGYMNSPTIYKACQAKGMKPVCDHSNYGDGKCKVVGGNWHLSHPHHDRSHGIDVNKVKWAFFYCGRANHQRSLINTETSHKWTKDRFERDGDTFCVTRDKDFIKNHGSFSHKGFALVRVPVKGAINSGSMFRACEKKGMKPVCDHGSYFDGRCVVVGGHKHMSRQDKTKGVWDAYFYCGRANGNKGLQHMQGRHRWSTSNDKDGETICTKPKNTAVKFEYRGYEMNRVPVTGYMNSGNILKACKAKGQKPVCDHKGYNDGKCKVLGGNWHFSHPSHNRQHKVDKNKVKWAFFYCGRANHQRSLINTGRTHKWTRDNIERDGDTFCAKRDPKWMKKYGTFSTKGYKLKRVAVVGKINSQSIYNACVKKGLRPVCDHGAYFDGRCEVVMGHRHMSRQDNIKGVMDAYFYCGRANHNRALQHQHRGHRWTNGNDANGETICTKRSPRLAFKFRGYIMTRVAVSGYMNSPNMFKACRGWQMKPLCDKKNYNDGKCQAVSGNWHFSHPSHDKRYKVDVNKVKWAFFYCGRANGNKALLNTGRTHKWTTNNRERDGDTFCAKRDPQFSKDHGSFTLHGYRVKRVPVAGKINSSSIFNACNKAAMKPVCDHASYFDGRCQVVNGNKHVTRQRKIKGIWDAYVYCGRSNHNRALQHMHSGHRWSNSHDQDGETLCTKQKSRKRAKGMDATFSFLWHGYEMHRVKVSGYMTSQNMLQACKNKGMLPVCDHANYNDGKCKSIGGNWHFSHPSHDKQHKIDVNKVKWAFFYCGRANGNKALLNTGRTHKWTHKNKERDGETFCTKKGKDFAKNRSKFGHKGFKLVRVAVAGRINSNSIWTACKTKKMRPVCDHESYFDGRCVVVNGNRHMSRQDGVKGVVSAFFYCGRANKDKALQHLHRGHRWTNGKDANGDTICTDTRGITFKFGGHMLVRVPVHGYMTSQNMYKACKAKGMKPVCDRNNYADGKCRPIGGSWHFSYPSHDKQHGIDVSKVTSAVFYCGRSNHNKGLLNTGRTHKWTKNNFERDGDTFCVKRDPSFLKQHGTFSTHGFTLTRVAVPGKINSATILKSCAAKGMRPVCDHGSYFDGRCVVVGGNKHMSRQDKVKGVTNAFFYCGHARNHKARQHMQGRHRWSTSHDEDGETICTKPMNVPKFVWNGHEMLRTKVKGVMNSANIMKACQLQGMKPICDHANYNDGKCKSIGGNWHFSHPSHDKQHKVDVNKVKWAFFYCGRANHNRALYNTQNSHKWTNGKQRNGDTFCTKAERKEFLKKHGTFGHHGRKLVRVHVPGKVNSNSIFEACKAKGLRPVCDHPSYFDGRCEVVNGKKHMSREDKVKGGHNAYYYCGHANRKRALQHVNRGHRWSKGTEEDVETVCTKRIDRFTIGYRGYSLVRTRVKGAMNSHSILEACKGNGMRPLCDHNSYRDANCHSFGENLHFSHPSHDQRLKVDKNKMKWAFFYCGRANSNKALYNTQNSHRWTNGKQSDGDTYCVAKGKRSKSSGAAGLLHVGDVVALYSPTHKRFVRMPAHGHQLDKSPEHNEHLPAQWKWEQFTVTHSQKSGQIGLFSAKHGKFVKMNGGRDMTRSSRRPDGNLPNGWHSEHFKVVKGRKGQIALWNPRHKRFMRMPNGKYIDRSGHRSDGSLPENWTWEQFKVVVVKKAGTNKGSCQGKVVLYQHGNFHGWQGQFLKGNYDQTRLKQHGARNNDASAITVPNGCVAIVYGNPNFSGWSATFHTGRYDNSKFTKGGARNDQVSSIRVRDSVFNHDGYTFTRLKVHGGRVNTNNIWKTCRSKGLRPVCDHGHYFDGRCEVVYGNKHMSRNSKVQGIDGAFFYSGRAHGSRALQHLRGGTSHRWSNGHEHGDTVCTKHHDRQELNFQFGGRNVIRTTVPGLMNSANMLKACAAKGMMPVCDHSSYNDGKCENIGGNWHFSHPRDDRKHGIDVRKVGWAFWYCGRAHHNKALINTENSHRWTKGYEQDGDTYCVKSGAHGSRLQVGDIVALYNKAHNKFVYMQQSQKELKAGPAMSPNKWDNAKEWNDAKWDFAKFKVVKTQHAGQIGLWNSRKGQTGRFIRMPNGRFLDKSGSHDDTMPNGWTWEHWKIVKADGGVALWNPKHERFMRMPDVGYMDKGHRNKHGPWEKFSVVIVQPGAKGTGCTGKVKLYEHGNFNGSKGRFTKGNYNSLNGRFKNDAASSIKVPNHCIAYLYQHGNFGGWKAVFPPGKYNYKHFRQRGARNDDASSIKVKDH